MSSETDIGTPVKRRSSPVAHTIRRLSPAVLLLLPLLAVLLIATAMRVGAAGGLRLPVQRGHSAQAQPRDPFMRPIATGNSSCNCQQRYRGVPAQMSSAAPIQQADVHHLARTDRSVVLTQAFVGARQPVDGGESLVYAAADPSHAAAPQPKRMDPVAVWIAGVGGVALVLLAIVGLIVAILLPENRRRPQPRHRRHHRAHADWPDVSR